MGNKSKSKEEVVELFRRHFADAGLFSSLDTYLARKQAYMETRTREDLIELKCAYEYVYSDMKCWLSAGTISDNTFWALVDALQEGL